MQMVVAGHARLCRTPSGALSPEAPTPHLPRGAGGPPRRAAGRVLPREAVVLEPDPLRRLLVAAAVETLGLRLRDDCTPVSACGPEVVFLPLTGTDDCRGASARARAAIGFGAPRTPARGEAAPLVVGYGAGPPALLAAHRLHGCTDLVLVLTAEGGGPCFAHLPASDPVVEAGLTEREADVLVLLLAGLTTPAIALRLGVAESTARSHCRAVLRKFGARDRRALRAGLRDAAPESPSCAPGGPAV